MTEPKTAQQINSSEWVDCPICGDCDMHKTTDKEGNALIECVNHACRSNGGDYEAPSRDQMKLKVALRLLVEKWRDTANEIAPPPYRTDAIAFTLRQCAKQLEEALK